MTLQMGKTSVDYFSYITWIGKKRSWHWKFKKLTLSLQRDEEAGKWQKLKTQTLSKYHKGGLGLSINMANDNFDLERLREL